MWIFFLSLNIINLDIHISLRCNFHSEIREQISLCQQLKNISWSILWQDHTTIINVHNRTKASKFWKGEHTVYDYFFPFEGKSLLNKLTFLLIKSQCLSKHSFRILRLEFWDETCIFQNNLHIIVLIRRKRYVHISWISGKLRIKLEVCLTVCLLENKQTNLKNKAE